MKTLPEMTRYLLPAARGFVEQAWVTLRRCYRYKFAQTAACLTNSASDVPPSIEAYSPPTGYSRLTTAADVYYCFRLLLGRNPNPEEWTGHSSRAGEDIENVVSSFVTSREFAQRGLLTRTYTEKIELVHLPSFSLFVSDDDLAVGHHVLRGHPYDPGIGIVLQRYVRPGMSAVDVGANIGSLTMLLASLIGPTGLVVAIEPNPENVKLLEASRRLNAFDQILVIQAAAGRRTSLLALNVSYSNGMTGQLPSNTEMILGTCTVSCFALDTLLPKNQKIDLIKIDTEGAEFNVIIGLTETIKKYKPIIISEFSPPTMPGVSHCTGSEYLQFLIELGYDIGVIEKDGSETMYGEDIDAIMDAYVQSGIDHIDIIVIPRC